MIASVSPLTGETLAVFDPISEAEVHEKVERARQAADSWALNPVEKRAKLLDRVARLLIERRDNLALLMTLEMGKTLRSAQAEVGKCAAGCRYYAEHGPAFVDPSPVDVDGERSFIRFDPLGVVLAVMPWNFPFWQVIRFAAPAIVAGNVGLLKHASNVPQCALALEEVFRDAGAPPGVFQTLLVESGAVAGLIGDDRVAAVTLTGSEGAGRSVAGHAGRHLKKCVLELGGSDPFIVMPSADLALAAATAVTARCINNGQSCIAAKRFIVHQAVADEFTARFVSGMESLKVGDPMDPAIDIGPLATRAIRDELAAQVTATVAAGARVLCGGSPIHGRGNFFEPTVLCDVPRGTPGWSEELFGPVAALFIVGDADEALAVANDTRFGLAASVWTADQAQAGMFSRRLQCGTVFVNAMVASDPRFPFGGVRASGYGRELSAWGLREFVNIRTVRHFHF
ncbi:MAG: NAD-dependent succinate-semialdehyde dehydrogenase [Gemmatimonadota bacterium]